MFKTKNKLVLALITSMALTALAHAEGRDSAGGSFVGDKLLEDYEMQGTTVISKAELEKSAAPILNRLEQKVPLFAEKLKEGFTDLKWYSEPKPFGDGKECLNKTMLVIQQVVRACQSKISVRIQKSFIDANPSTLPDLIVHELIQHYKLKYQNNNILDEEMFEVSRAVRNPKLSADELVKIIEKDKFGTYLTAENHKQLMSLVKDAICNDKSAFEGLYNVKKFADSLRLGNGVIDYIQGIDAIYEYHQDVDSDVKTDKLREKTNQYRKQYKCEQSSSALKTDGSGETGTVK